MAIIFAGTSTSDFQRRYGNVSSVTNTDILPAGVGEGVYTGTNGHFEVKFQEMTDIWIRFNMHRSSTAPYHNGTERGMFEISNEGSDRAFFKLVHESLSNVINVHHVTGNNTTVMVPAGVHVTTSRRQVDIHFKIDETDGVVEYYLDGILQYEYYGNTTMPNVSSIDLLRFDRAYETASPYTAVTYSGIIVADEDTRFFRFNLRKPAYWGTDRQWDFEPDVTISNITQTGDYRTSRHLKYMEYGSKHGFRATSLSNIREGVIRAYIPTVNAQNLKYDPNAQLKFFVKHGTTEVESEPVRAGFDTYGVMQSSFTELNGQLMTTSMLANLEYGVISHPPAEDKLPEFVEYQVIKSSGRYRVPEYVDEIDVLLLGGGGAGGQSFTSATLAGGGGGAGGIVTVNGIKVEPGQEFKVVVGKGGSGGGHGSNADVNSSGGNTYFDTYVALGGGRGGSMAGSSSGVDALSGASGGGARSGITSSVSGTSPQGREGGTSVSSGSGGGGGGYGSSGLNGSTIAGGAGGNGTTLAELGWGDAVAYGAPSTIAAGGGGGARTETSTPGNGGSEVGGRGGEFNGLGGHAVPLTGSGGGGAGAQPGVTSPSGGRRGGDGSSGFIIVRHKSSFLAAVNLTIAADGDIVGAKGSPWSSTLGSITNPVNTYTVTHIFDDLSDNSSNFGIVGDFSDKESITVRLNQKERFTLEFEEYDALNNYSSFKGSKKFGLKEGKPHVIEVMYLTDIPTPNFTPEELTSGLIGAFVEPWPNTADHGGVLGEIPGLDGVEAFYLTDSDSDNHSTLMAAGFYVLPYIDLTFKGVGTYRYPFSENYDDTLLARTIFRHPDEVVGFETGKSYYVTASIPNTFYAEEFGNIIGFQSPEVFATNGGSFLQTNSGAYMVAGLCDNYNGGRAYLSLYGNTESTIPTATVTIVGLGTFTFAEPSYTSSNVGYTVYRSGLMGLNASAYYKAVVRLNVA